MAVTRQTQSDAAPRAGKAAVEKAAKKAEKVGTPSAPRTAASRSAAPRPVVTSGNTRDKSVASNKAQKDRENRLDTLKQISDVKVPDLEDAIAGVSHASLVKFMRHRVGMRMTDSRVENYTRVLKGYAALCEVPNTRPGLMTFTVCKLTTICKDAHLHGYSKANKIPLVNMILTARKKLDSFIVNRPDDPEESTDAPIQADTDDEYESDAES